MRRVTPAYRVGQDVYYIGSLGTVVYIDDYTEEMTIELRSGETVTVYTFSASVAPRV